MTISLRPGSVVLIALVAGCAGPATWAHDPADDIGLETTAFTAWVTETACASGDSSDGRIVGPDIEVSDESIVVTFQVRAQLGLAQTCPSNLAAPVVVRLPEALGDRILLDGGREPPAEAPVCTNRFRVCD